MKNAQKQIRKNTKINKLVFQGLQLSIHNANMTMLIGNVTDIVAENVAVRVKGERIKHDVSKKATYKKGKMFL